MARLPLKLIVVTSALWFSGWAVAPAQAQDAAAVRTWHAATGGFKVDAELVDVREGKVQLKKSDGSTLWVPLDKLSLSDVKFVNAELAKARQQVEKIPSGKPPATKPVPAADNTATPASPAETSEEPAEPTDDSMQADADADMDGADALSNGKGGKGATRSPFAGMRDTNLALGQVSSHDLIFPTMLSPWMAARKHASGGQQYVVYNIRTGKSGNPFVVEGIGSYSALSPDGATLALSSGFPAKIAIYSTSTGKKQRDLELVGNQTISTIIFISTTQLLVNGGFQTPASIFDVKTGKVVKTMDIEGHLSRKYAVSPDGKWLAVPGNSLVALYDLKSAKLKNQLPVVPSKGSSASHVSIDDVAFCSDGTELAVIGSSSNGEFQVFSLKSGRPVVKHTLSERISNFASASQYAGPAVETIPNNKGYILYGCAIVDRENGGPIWVDKPAQGEQASNFRVLIDDQRQLKMISNFSSLRFDVVKLPWSDISRSKDLVSKGGTVEDAGLPAVRPVSSNAAKSIDGALNPKPFEGKKVESEVVARPKAIPLDRSLGMFHQVRFASPKSGVCVTMPTLFAMGRMDKDGPKKSVLVIDLKKGDVGKSVEVDFLSQVHDVSPSGKWLVGTTGSRNDRVDVFNLETSKHELGFRPNAETEFASPFTGVSFLSDDILVTIVGNKATAWEFPELKPLYKFSCLGGVFRFPSSPLFLHRNEQGWYVRSVRDGRIEGTLEGSNSINTEFVRSAHFRADESALATIVGYERDQRLVVWDLLTGKRTYNIPLSNLASSRVILSLDASGRMLFNGTSSKRQLEDVALPMTDSVMWTGDNQLLLRWMRNDRDRFSEGAEVSQIVYSLFNLENSRMLWDYRVPTGALVDGGPEGQLWFLESSKRQQALVGVSVPTKEAMLKIADAPAPKLLIAKGDDLMADIQVMISGDKLADEVLRDQVVSALVKNLARHEVDVSERAGIKLTIRVTHFVSGSNFSRNESTKLLATAKLTDISNNLLWQRDRIIDAQKPDQGGKQILAENQRRLQWESTLDWIRETVDPQEIYEKWYYRGIGESLLSADGERIVEMKTSADGR